MMTGNATKRERFEHDTFHHLETLWSTAQCLTMRHSLAENLVLKTMTGAYLEWQDSNDITNSKVRLFRILTREFFSLGNRNNQWQRSTSLISENIRATSYSKEGDHQNMMTAIDNSQLQQLSKIPDVIVKGAIARLRPHSRLMMILFYREKFSYTDIAYITDLPNNIIRMKLNRLRKMIPGYILMTADYLKETSNSQLPDGKNDGKIVRDHMQISPKKASLSNREYLTSAVTESWENEGGAIVNKSGRRSL